MNTLMKRLHIVSIVLAGTLCAHALGKSDTITLIGGDVLLCTIISESETSVTVDHPALGRIELSRERIESIVRTAPPVPEAAATVAAAVGVGTAAIASAEAECSREGGQRPPGQGSQAALGSRPQ